MQHLIGVENYLYGGTASQTRILVNKPCTHFFACLLACFNQTWLTAAMATSGSVIEMPSDKLWLDTFIVCALFLLWIMEGPMTILANSLANKERWHRICRCYWQWQFNSICSDSVNVCNGSIWVVTLIPFFSNSWNTFYFMLFKKNGHRLKPMCSIMTVITSSTHRKTVIL